MSESIINRAVESVMDLIDGMGNFAVIKRGALGTETGLSCEIGPTTPETVFLDKNQYIPVDLTLNGKHPDLNVLSDTLNGIHETLTFLKSYPSADDWKIVDISTGTEPQIIEREFNNVWVMASGLIVKIETKKE